MGFLTGAMTPVSFSVFREADKVRKSGQGMPKNSNSLGIALRTCIKATALTSASDPSPPLHYPGSQGKKKKKKKKLHQKEGKTELNSKILVNCLGIR